MILVFKPDGGFQYSIDQATIDMVEDDGGLIVIEHDGEVDFTTQRPILSEDKKSVTWEEYVQEPPPAISGD